MNASDILFVHNNFPGQFGFLATALKNRGLRCLAIGSETARPVEIPVRRWKLPRGSTKDIFPLATRWEADIMRGRAAAEIALSMKSQGFSPKLIIAHPGWGETLLLGEVFPEAKQILHGEFYYRSTGLDVGFDPEFGVPDQNERFAVAAKNAAFALAYLQADRIVSPTAFQASVFPRPLQPLISVIHEGVDTALAKPKPNVTLKLENGPTFDGSTPLITFINRNFEPLRGFQIFMRALPRLMAERPDAHVLLIGAGDGRGYGGQFAGGSWKSKMMAEVGDKLDASRLHFVGRVAHPWMLDALRVSWAHVYYTYPFVLSWSLLEAMACECFIIGSDTAPMHDAVENGKNGLLLDFFDVDALSNAMIQACRTPEAFKSMRKAARRTVVERFDQASLCQPAWLKLVDDVLAEP